MSGKMSDQPRPLSFKFELGMAIFWFPVFFCIFPIFLGFPSDLLAYFSQAGLAYTAFRIAARFLEPLMGEEFRCWIWAPIVILAGAAAALAAYMLAILFGWPADLVYFGVFVMSAWVMLAPLHI